MRLRHGLHRLRRALRRPAYATTLAAAALAAALAAATLAAALAAAALAAAALAAPDAAPLLLRGIQERCWCAVPLG